MHWKEAKLKNCAARFPYSMRKPLMHRCHELLKVVSTGVSSNLGVSWL